MYLLFGRLKTLLVRALPLVPGFASRSVPMVRVFCSGEGADECQAMRKSLGRLHLKGVIPGVAERSPVVQDGSELREWPQRLGQRLGQGKCGVRRFKPAGCGSAQLPS